jgi:ketosteroid isomerase-like protein
MPARSPEDLDRLFESAMNAGDLDALVALYEPRATLSPEPGTVVTGTPALREALGGFVAAKPRITLKPRLVAQSGDIALTTSRWTLSGHGPDGKPMEMQGQSAEVARRQPDGTWLFVIDSPWGLESS